MSKALLKTVFVCLTLAAAGSIASAVDLQGIMRDTQRTTKQGERFTMVWWMPQIYWEQTFAEANHLTPAAKQEILKLLSEHVMIAIIDARFDPTAAMHPKSADEIAAKLQVTLLGKEVERVPEAKLSEPMRNLLSGMRPVLQNTLGGFGKAMHIFVYPAKGGAWENKTGELRIRYDDQDNRWRLPLACTLPNKRDAKTGETFPGDYKFNPYTGDRLP